MWVAKYDLDGNVIYVTTPFSPPNNNPVQTEFVNGGQVVVAGSTGDIYISGELFGNFIFDEDDVFVNVDSVNTTLSAVFVTKSSADGNWEWIRIYINSIPTNIDKNPKLTVAEDSDSVYVTSFGVGSVTYYNNENPDTDDDNDTFVCCGSGSLDLLISKISTNPGGWLCSCSIPGVIDNMSINIVSKEEDVYVAGTHSVVCNSRSDGFILNIES